MNSLYKYLPFSKEQLDEEQKRLIICLEDGKYLQHQSLSQRIISVFSNKPKIGGIYIHGGVGLGKSTICKAYFDASPVAADDKLYIHYHELLQQLHNAMHDAQKDHHNIQDVVVHIAMQMQYKLLVIDEFSVNDITDAMILHRLFIQLYKNGTLIIMTSNVAPKNLYEGGLQRERFLPFIEHLEKHFKIVALKSQYDYRVSKLCSQQERIILGEGSYQKLHNTIDAIVPFDILAPYNLVVFGRELVLQQAGHRILLTNFAELCTQELSYNDYLEICQHFDAVIMQNVPKLDDERLNEVVRFIHLIDAIYMKQIVFFMNSNAEMDALYCGQMRSKEFRRTKSRLIEMNAADYAAGNK